jgi:hypothetical protein
MPLSFCRERDELERQINAVLRQISANSTEASRIARDAVDESEEAHAKSHASFIALHNADSLLKERLDTLKQCLELHKDCHGCATAGPWPTRMKDSSDRSPAEE